VCLWKKKQGRGGGGLDHSPIRANAKLRRGGRDPGRAAFLEESNGKEKICDGGEGLY